MLSGKLYFTPCTDYNATVKKGRTMKFLCANALLVTVGKPSEHYRPDLVSTNPITQKLDMPRGQTGLTDAALVIMREKGNRFVPCRVSGLNGDDMYHAARACRSTALLDSKLISWKQYSTYMYYD